MKTSIQTIRLTLALGLALLAGPVSTSAQTFTVLKNLTGETGGLVRGSLILSDGYLYGAAEAGGLYVGGTLFKIKADGSEDLLVLKDFADPFLTADGSGPGGLVLSGGKLYGTTLNGGSEGWGIIFEFNPADSAYRIIKSFTPSTANDGKVPKAALVVSGSTLYGTTVLGGSAGLGTVFKIDINGSGYQILHHFTGFSDDMTANDDGDGPDGWLVLDGSTLYGTTTGGGNTTSGTIFKIGTDGNNYSILRHFNVDQDGGLPTAGLVLSGGVLYGTATSGGTGGSGTVFKIGTGGSGFQVLKHFAGGANDGATPNAGLILDGSTLYGTTQLGGNDSAGTVFKISTDGSTFAVLKSFNGTTDGSGPIAGLVKSGNTLYGTAGIGGTDAFGTIFSLTVSGGSTAPTITSVTGPANGSYKAGQNLSFTVTFSASVTVTGTPQLPLTIGSTARNATYASGSPGTALTFTYTVQAGETDTDGIASASPLALNSGTIKATSGGTDATLTFTPPTTTAVRVDTTAPALATVTLSDMALAIGETATVTFTFTEAVTGFTPADLTVANGTISALISADGGITWTGTLTPNASTEDTSNVITLDLTGVIDLAGNAGTGTTTSGNYAIDTTPPTISISVPSATTVATGGSVTYTVTYADANFASSTLTNNHVTLNKTGTADGTVAVTGSGLTRTVTISSITGVGTLGISIAVGTASDLAGNTAPEAGSSATFTVAPPNQPPSGADKTLAINEDSTHTFTAADFGFADPNDTPAHALFAVKITTLPGAGALTNNNVAVTAGQFIPVVDLTGGKLTFTPAGNANGDGYASFTFQVQDNGGTANGGVDLDATARTMTINVTAVNDAPSFTLSIPSVPVVAWGRNNEGQTKIPPGLSGVVAIAAGGYHTVALKNDGTVVAWGGTNSGQTTIPNGLSGVKAIAAGFGHTVALKNDGTVVAWGRNSEDQTTIPPGLSGVKAIAAGFGHTVALKNDGTVVAWGYNHDGETTIPPGLSGVKAIAAGDLHTVALKNDGTVLAWGVNNYDQTTIPPDLSGVKAIAAGDAHTVALKNDGTVVAWGNDDYGTATIPPGLSGVVAIAAGGAHTVALKNDGTVVAWGYNGDGETTIPNGLSGVVAIAAGLGHTVALIDTGVSVPVNSSAFTRAGFVTGISPGPANEAGQTVSFTVTADNTALFTPTGRPAIAADGTLTFTPAANAIGTATITFTAQDNGGTANGGVDTSAPQTFTITIVLRIPCLFNAMASSPAPAGAARVAPRISSPTIALAMFHALEGLMGESAEGQRLKALYWVHGSEVIQIMQSEPDLKQLMKSLVTSFQPLVLSLLSGRGQQAQITQPMIDQLNVVWTRLVNSASPRLAVALTTERTRHNGFQDFVGQNFSQWAQMLQVPAPTTARVQITSVSSANGQVQMEANAVEAASVSLWGSSDLMNWIPVPGAQQQTDGFTLLLTDPNPGVPWRFYRAVLVP